MKAATTKPRNSRAPRKTAKAAAEKTALFQVGTPDGCLTEEQRQDLVEVLSEPYMDLDDVEPCDEHHIDCECHRCCPAPVPPVHQRWTQMFAILSKGASIHLSTPARLEAWEWFRKGSAKAVVPMTGKGTALLIAGILVFERDGILKGVPKGGRK